MVKSLKKSSSDKKMNLSLLRLSKKGSSRKSSSSKKQPRSSSQDDELESLVMGANLTSKQEARLMVHYAGRKALLIDHLKLLRSAQKELEKETTRTQDSDIYGMHNGTNDDELPSVSEGEEHSTTPSSEEGIVADVSSCQRTVPVVYNIIFTSLMLNHSHDIFYSFSDSDIATTRFESARDYGLRGRVGATRRGGCNFAIHAGRVGKSIRQYCGRG